MENYTSVLLKIYRRTYKINIWKEIKNLLKNARTRGHVLLVIFVILSFTMFGSAFSQNNGLFFIVTVLFLLNTFFLGLELSKYSKSQIEIRDQWEERLSSFNEILLEYGLENDIIINKCIDFIEKEIERETRKRERTHDVLFKYFVTFLLSLFIFFGKEFWKRIEPGVSSSVIINIIIFLVILILFYLMLWLSGFISMIVNKNNDYEKLVSALRGIVLYRSEVKLKVVSQITEENTVTKLIEEI
ncbi:hypothetical protein [Vagococcus carniphilus]|uniref:hypothetical protein n=1 Tax=Vagococcus carniphilus TaxID=218144 RepID=UPI003B5A2513